MVAPCGSKIPPGERPIQLVCDEFPPDPLGFVEERRQILLPGAEIDDRDAQSGPPFQDRRRQEERAISHEAVDDLAVDPVELLVRPGTARGFPARDWPRFPAWGA